MKQLVLQLDDSSVLWWRSLLFYLSKTVKRDPSLWWAWRSVSVEYVWISVMTCLVIGSNISNESACILWVLAYSCHGAIYPSWVLFFFGFGFGIGIGFSSLLLVWKWISSFSSCRWALMPQSVVKLCLKKKLLSVGRKMNSAACLINYPPASAKLF